MFNPQLFPKVAVHSGSFHADEVAAIATLTLALNAQGIQVLQDADIHAPALTGVLRVFRTRDPAILAACDIAVDVGMEYVPERGRFDHHQRGGAGARSEGRATPFAASGLVWLAYGREAVRAVQPQLTPAQLESVWTRIDQEFIQPLDSCDNGIGLGGPTGVQLPALVGSMNPTWLTGDTDPVRVGQAFERAVAMVRGLLEAAIQNAAAKELARDVVVDALQHERGGIVVLPRSMPWEDAVCTHSATARFVILPASSGESFHAYAVPAAPRSFHRRMLFPKSWAGLEHNDLAQATGVDDAVFCHINRFIAVSKTLEGAKRLAALAF